MSDLEISKKIENILIAIEGLKVNIEYIKDDITNIKEEDRLQNKLLAEHIKGVQTNTLRLNEEINKRNTLEELLLKDLAQSNLKIQENKTRIEKIEEIPKSLKGTKKVLLWIGGIVASIGATLKVLQEYLPWN